MIHRLGGSASTRAGFAIVVAVLLFAAACTGERSSPEDGGSPLPTLDTELPSTTRPIPPAEPVEVPSSPAGEALAWVLEHVGSAPEEEAIVERFDEAFLASIPPAGVSAVMQSLGEPGDLVEVVHAGDHELAVLVELGAEIVQIQLVVEPSPPHRMSGLLFTPAIPTPDLPSSVADAERDWPPLAERASLLVAQVVNGECRPVVSVAADRSDPVGSTAKLYVLAAVASAVLDGTISWDQPVPILDELRSHPSGTFHELPAGTERTVLEHATAMISVSDNTATDHLIHLVGREAVEEATELLGHSRPELNRPFLTTREMFLVKLDGVGDEALDAFLGGDEAARRALLDEWASLTLPGLEAFSPTPVLIDEVEWFASPVDLCQAMVVLGELAEWPGLEPLADILEAPPGTVDAGNDEVWFKGGSEPGVLNLTMRIDDGDRVVVASGTLVDERTVLVPAGGALRWLTAAAGLALG